MTDDAGVAVDFFGFGGEMESAFMDRKEAVDRWTVICRTKIHEEFEAYIDSM